MATHIVEQGDTLAKIARKFGTTVNELVRLNNIANRSLIRVGQELLLPNGEVEQEPVPAGAFVFPVKGYRGRVELHHGSHIGGSDIFAARGTPVLAMRGGVVVAAGTEATDRHGGNNVMIRGDDGLTYYYAHGDRPPQVAVGEQVATGAFLFGVNETGNARGTGDHLHIGIGFGIQDGIGPAGGTGIGFNAVELLRAVLDGATHPRRQGRARQFLVLDVGHLGLNVREQPSHSAPIVGSLNEGDVVDGEDTIVEAEGRSWRRLLNPDGFVADQFLAPK
jgi:murein DD-endopeptidase MepM/ murein hydrolase activator NlpD